MYHSFCPEILHHEGHVISTNTDPHHFAQAHDPSGRAHTGTGSHYTRTLCCTIISALFVLFFILLVIIVR